LLQNFYKGANRFWFAFLWSVNVDFELFTRKTVPFNEKKEQVFFETLASSENTVNLCVTGLLTGTNAPNLPPEYTVPNLLHNNSLISIYYNPPIFPEKSS